MTSIMATITGMMTAATANHSKDPDKPPRTPRGLFLPVN